MQIIVPLPERDLRLLISDRVHYLDCTVASNAAFGLRFEVRTRSTLHTREPVLKEPWCSCRI